MKTNYTHIREFYQTRHNNTFKLTNMSAQKFGVVILQHYCGFKLLIIGRKFSLFYTSYFDLIVCSLYVF